MKKILVFVTLLLCANLIFGQSISMGIHDGVDNDTEIDVSALNPGDKVYISLSVDAIDPGEVIWGMGLFFNVPAGYLSWDGTGAVPMPGVTYVNPLFPPVVLPANVAVNWYLHSNGVENVFGYLQGDGGSFVDLTGQTFPVTILTLQFTYLGGVLPGESIPITYSIEAKDDGGWKVGGITEVYYNDFFEFFPTTNLAGATLYGGGGGGTPGLWTGMGASASWFDTGNWDDGAVPDQTIDVVIPAAAGMYPNPEIGTNMGVPEIALAASVVNDAVISIMADGYMTVVGAFTNNGSLLMYSDAVNSASFICADAIEGTFQYDRYLDVTTALPAGERGWHYISSPVLGFTAGGNLNDYYLNTFENGDWVYQQGLGFPNCTPPAVTNGVMEGWSVKLDENYAANLCAPINPATGMTVEFMGAPYFGPQAIALNPVAGYQLIGNPYPSYWDYEAFYPNPAGMTDAMYMWNEDANNYSAWIFGGSGINGGTEFIPPAQGFFIETTGAGGSLTFDPSEQAHVIGQPFYKDELSSVVKLMASANGYTDETMVRFSENSTINRDNNDAMKFKSPGTGVPALYTKADNLDIAINGMPATATVPVYFECSLNGTYTIEAVETSDFENVVLEDLLTGEQTDLLVSGHTFNYTAGENTGRFILHFTPLGVNDISANSINIWAANQTIYVQAPATTGDIVVFNLMGQEVVRTAIEAGVNEIPMNESNTYYIVKVLGSEVTETGKVFIK